MNIKPTPEQVHAWCCEASVDGRTLGAQVVRIAELAVAWGAQQSQDGKRLDALANPGWELSMNDDPECFDDEIWVVHRVSGGRNDREWTLIGKGANPRAAIDAAMKGEQT